MKCLICHENDPIFEREICSECNKLPSYTYYRNGTFTTKYSGMILNGRKVLDTSFIVIDKPTIPLIKTNKKWWKFWEK